MNTYQQTPDFYKDYIAHYNHNHDPRNGQFTSVGRVISSSEEKKQRKLSKKWNYIEPENKKKAHTYIAKKAAISAATIAAGQVGTQAYINKQILNKPIKTAFNKKTAKRAAIYGLILGASNMAYDELLYKRKGVIRK